MKIKILPVYPRTPVILRGLDHVRGTLFLYHRVEALDVVVSLAHRHPIIDRLLLSRAKVAGESDDRIRQAVFNRVFGKRAVLGIFMRPFLALRVKDAG